MGFYNTQTSVPVSGDVHDAVMSLFDTLAEGFVFGNLLMLLLFTPGPDNTEVFVWRDIHLLSSTAFTRGGGG